MKIFIRSCRGEVAPVEAVPVTFPDFPFMQDFFVTPYMGHNRGPFEPAETWTVSHAGTGFCLPIDYHPSVEAAEAAALAFFIKEQVTPAKWARILREAEAKIAKLP